MANNFDAWWDNVGQQQLREMQTAPQMSPQQPAATVGARSVYSQWIDDKSEQAVVRANTAVGLATPEQATEAERAVAVASWYKENQNVDLSPEMAMVASDSLVSMMEHQQRQEVFRESPRLAQWTVSNPIHAAIAKKELNNLSGAESLANSVGRGADQLTTAAFHRMRSDAAADKLEQLIETQRIYVEHFGGVDPERFDDAIAQAQHDAEWKLATEQSNLDRIDQTYGRSAADAEVNRRMAVVGEMDGAVEQTLGFIDIIADEPLAFTHWLFGTAAESVPAMGAAAAATLATRKPTVGAAIMGAGSFARSNALAFSQIANEGGYDLTDPADRARLASDPAVLANLGDRAFTYGAVVGIVDGLSGGIAGKTLAKSPAGNMVLQAMTQAAMGSGGEFLGLLASGQKINMAEIIVEGLAEIVTAPIEVIGVGGAAIRRSQNVAKDRAFFEALAENVEESGLKKSMPEQYRSAIAALTANGAVETLYIDATRLTELFQSGSVTVEEFANAVPSLTTEAVQTAIDSGGLLEIPTASYATDIVGTDFDAILRDHLTTAADSMSVAEARELETRLKEATKEASTLVDKIDSGQQALEATAEEARSNLVSDLQRAGRTSQAAEREALQAVAFASSMSQRMGIEMDEFLRRYPLMRVVGAQDARAAQRIETGELPNLAASGEGPDADAVRGAATAAGLDETATADELADALEEFGESADVDDIVLNQSVELRRGGEDLTAFGVPAGETVKVRHLAEALERRTRETIGTIERDDRGPAAMDHMSDAMAEEVIFEMDEIPADQSAVGWYTEKLNRSIDTLATVFPELNADADLSGSAMAGPQRLGTAKNARDFFVALLAITSDGQKVLRNFRHAAAVYEIFRETGTLPTDAQAGVRSKSVLTNFSHLNRLMDEYGPAGMHTHMLEEFTVSEINAQLRAQGHKTASQMPASAVLPRAAVLLGPKLGSFYANLMGADGYLTMDRWFSRTVNRYRGQLVPRVKGLEGAERDSKGNLLGMARFKSLIGHPTISDADAIPLIITYQDDYATKKFKNGTEIEKAANTLHKKLFTEIEDQPFGAGDRGFLIAMVKQTQKKLAKAGHDVSVADIQAIIWYYEKRLYTALGARKSDDISFEEAASRVVADELASNLDRSGRPTTELYQRAAGRRAVEAERGAGDAEIGDFQGELTPEVFRKKNWFVVTATQEAVGGPMDPANVAANDALRAKLDKNGTEYVEVGGVYQGEDQGTNFLIIGSKVTAKAFGRIYHQESVLTREGLVYTDGRPNTPVDHDNTLIGDAAKEQDFYSVMPDGTAFTLDLRFGEEAVEGRTLDLRADGRLELIHWSDAPHKAVDPAFASKGPLRGAERKRNGPKKAFFGINPRLTNRDTGTGYLREAGLGAFRHTVSVDPESMYDWFADPDGLRETIDAATSSQQRLGAYEDAIKKAGYAGFYVLEDGSGRAPHGDAATLFESAKVENVLDESDVEAVTRAQIEQDIIVPDFRYYLDETEDSILIPTDAITPIRARTDGIANGRGFMAAAAKGEQLRRGPLQVRDDGNGQYTLWDGNSTYAIASEAGMPVLPARVLTEAEFNREVAEKNANKILNPDGKPKHRTVLTAELGENASAALISELRRRQGFDSLARATAHQAANSKTLNDTAREVSEEIGGGFVEGPAKQPDSIERKVHDKYGGNYSLVSDLVRTTITVHTPAEAEAAVKALGKTFHVVDEGWASTTEGYFDRKITVIMADGMLGEVQLMPAEMLQSKMDDGGHEMYEEWRNTSTSRARKAELHSEMIALYGAVLSKLTVDFRQMLGIVASAPPIAASAVETSASETSGDRSSDQIAEGSTDDQAGSPDIEGIKLKAAEPSAETTVGKTPSDKKYFIGVSPFDPNIADATVDVNEKGTTKLEQRARGSIILPRKAGEGAQPVVNLFQDADLSTFLHESGHYFMFVLEDIVARGDAPAQMQADWDALKGWWTSNAAEVAKDGDVTEADVLTVLSGRSTGDPEVDLKVNVGMQEQFARGYEAYLLEGKAPSNALRSAFEAFSAWLLSIYRTVSKLNVEINDDVRQVFDRMLATENELARVAEDNNMDELVASSAKELGISAAEYDALVVLSREAQDEARQTLLKEIMAPLRAARKAEQKAARAKLYEKFEREVNSRPANRAREWMGNQRWLGEENQPDLLPTDLRLDRAALIEVYGEKVVKALPRGKRPIWTSDGTGVSADEVAGWFGFKSGDEMIQALLAAPNAKKEINSRTDAAMRAENQDILVLGKVEEVAVDALHGDKRGQLLAAELRALSKRATKKTPVTSRTQARHIARKLIRQMPLRKAIRYKTYLVAERRAAERSQQLLAKGDLDGAYEAKRHQLLNYSLYMESRTANELMGKVERKVAQLGKKGTRKNLEGGYLPAIDAILTKYDFRKMSARTEDRRAALNEYVEMMTNSGRANELAIPDYVLNEAHRQPYKTLSVAELEGVYDSLRNIEHSARMKKKLVDAQSQRELDAVVDDVVAEFNANVKDVPTNRVQTKKEKKRAGRRELLNLWLNTDSILRKIGGFEMGAAYKAIKAPIDAASDVAQQMRSDAAEAFKNLYGVYTRREQNNMAVRREHKELNGSFSQWDLISAALNMGNEDNLARLMDKDTGRGFNAAQVEYIKSQLSSRDWKFVQSVWDYVDSYWGQIAERERRTTGVAPTKVAAAEVATPFGILRGGYYPIKYAGSMSQTVSSEDINELMANTRAGRFGKAQTRSGHLKERAGGSGGRVLQLGMEVLHQHIGQVIHDIAFSEATNNSWRILSDPQVKAAFENKALGADHDALEMWLQDVATGQISGGGYFGRVALRAKSGFTLAKLAFNMSTVLVQLTGITQSLVVVGKKNFAIGTSEYMKNPLRAAADVKERSIFMAERETTFQRDINDIMGDITQGPTGSMLTRWQHNVGRLGFWMMQKTQFYSVDMPTWLGAHHQATTEKGMTDVEASKYADRMVARAQASGQFADRSAFERGTLSRDTRQNGFVRLFTTLGSYMFAKGNLAYGEVGKMRRDITGFNAASFTAAFSGVVNLGLLFTVEAIFYNLIKGTLPDQDEDEGWAEFLAKETALSMFGTLPVVRDAASAYQGFDAGAYGSILTTFTRPLEQIEQGEVDKALVRSLTNAAGVVYGLPSTQVNRAIDAWWRLEEGEDVAPIEVLMGARR